MAESRAIRQYVQVGLYNLLMNAAHSISQAEVLAQVSTLLPITDGSLATARTLATRSSRLPQQEDSTIPTTSTRSSTTCQH